MAGLVGQSTAVALGWQLYENQSDWAGLDAESGPTSRSRSAKPTRQSAATAVSIFAHGSEDVSVCVCIDGWRCASFVEQRRRWRAEQSIGSWRRPRLVTDRGAFLANRFQMVVNELERERQGKLGTFMRSTVG